MRVSLSLAIAFACSIPTAALAQGLTPDESVKQMKLPPGFSVRCVASEPMIRQPLSMSFDSRGRLWVLQYLQYPNPAGLKPVKQDQYLRTQWDKVPEPPPKGVKGLDRITICSDPDENGVYRKSKDFVSGLNLASGFCLGNGGVYVVQPPYLLYYPDKNEDDIPDGDPEVLLSGFGLDDTHSLANSLQWGPDGWLYGAAGSTSTCKIKDPSGKVKEPIEFQQGLWRYHPKTKQFELFSEGGGNTYGLDFDRHGNAISGTNWGGFAMLHQMQGAYYVKGFSKHGPLHNPHAYGYFDHVPYKNFKGGHVTCGGILYEADVYPKEFHHQYIAGNLLSNAVYWHKMTPKGASFTAEHGGELMETNDTWFRPVDLQLGPDGCVYVADWYDKRAAHLDPIDNWDKTNGRIYKIEYTGAKRLEPFDLRKKSNAELVELLKHPNAWWRREARRLLGERPADKEMHKKLLGIVAEEKGQAALESLWAWYMSGGWAETETPLLFNHENPDVRAWTARFLGDAGVIQLEHVRKYMRLLSDDKNPVVLAQLLCSARRLPAAETTSICTPLSDSPIVAADPHLPHLLWWAVEPKVVVNDGSGFGASYGLVGLHTSPNGLFLAERFARLAGSAAVSEGLDPEIYNLLQPQPLLDEGKQKRIVQAVMRGLDASPRLDSKHHLAKELEEILDYWVRVDPNDELLIRVGAKLGVQKASDRVRALATDDKLQANESGKWRALAIRIKQVDSWAKGVAVLPAVSSDQVRTDLLAAIGAADEPDTPTKLLAVYPQCQAKTQQGVISLLLSRPKWSLAIFQAHADGKFPKADLTVDHARTAVALNDPELTKLVEKQFGKLASTAGEKRARIDALNLIMSREKPGDPSKGKAVFAKSCAACHQLFGEGAKVGPDLTSADRKNRYALLTNIVDPSGYIRPEFVSHVVSTFDGRTMTGVVTEQNTEKITLANYVNNKVETTVVVRKDIDKLDASAVSLMPEKLLDTMSEAEIRDLLAYVMSDPKTPLTPSPSPPRREGRKIRIALVSGSLEYKSDDTLPVLQKLLEDKYPVECVRIFRKTDTEIPGLDKLVECDLAIFFTRRLKIDGEQLKAVKAYCESGKPVIGLRTASHGFQNWLEMDKEVFGGNYKNHYGAGPKCEVKVTDAGKDHPILKGVKPFASKGSLYKNPDLSKDVKVLLTGTAQENTEPIAWVRELKVGDNTQRVFYTSLGHPKDFDDENFTRLLRNAIGWCTGDDRLSK